MAVPISDEVAERFAIELVSHAGNQTQAAIACGYKPGESARSSGKDLSRHPKVLQRLQGLTAQKLATLSPQAINTLGKLLTHKSGYIRLEAAKDILNRNGIGTEQRQQQHQPVLIRINLDAAKPPDETMITYHGVQDKNVSDIKDLDNNGMSVSAPGPQDQRSDLTLSRNALEISPGNEQIEPGTPHPYAASTTHLPQNDQGGSKSPDRNIETTPPHDFSSGVTPPHDFPRKVKSSSPLKNDGHSQANSALPIVGTLSQKVSEPLDFSLMEVEGFDLD